MNSNNKKTSIKELIENQQGINLKRREIIQVCKYCKEGFIKKKKLKTETCTRCRDKRIQSKYYKERIKERIIKEFNLSENFKCIHNGSIGFGIVYKKKSIYFNSRTDTIKKEDVLKYLNEIKEDVDNRIKKLNEDKEE